MRRKLLVAVLTGVLALTAVGCGQKADSTANKVEATPVKVAKVDKGKVVNTVTVTGKVTAGMEVNVVPKVPGKTASVLVDVGQRVTKGQVLLRLETSDIEAQLKSAQAALAVQKSLGDQAAIRYRDALDNYNRMQYLFSQGAVSQTTLDSAKVSLDQAQASYNPSGGNSQTSASIRQAQAGIDALRVQLSNMVITSPTDGIIAARNIEPGEMASSASPVFTIVNTDRMIVESNLAESEVNLASVGEQVNVMVKAVRDVPYIGKVLSVSPSANAQTKAFPLRVQLENKDANLKSGMIAEVILNTKAKDGVLLVPKEAVMDRVNKKVVFVVDKGAAREKTVTVGLSDDANIEITSGLKEGDQIVVDGQQLLADQSPVTVQQ